MPRPKGISDKTWRKIKSCEDQVKRKKKGKKVNPYAVCRASVMGRRKK